MPNYKRPRVPGATIFFTVALRERGDDLLVREIDRLRDAVRKTRAERPFRIDAWVVLPDHLHAVWTLPEGEADFSTRWRLIKARFSRGLPRGPRRPSDLARNERAIWQRRFWEHHVRGAADLAACKRYCHLNPVRHGLAETPEAWPFSTVHREIRHGRWP
ncbi:MAG: REP-associated tyrosine transposase [Rhodosalinus sp.]|uniref:REP-associated tyrosine transposase n=1 Tax=Rhodosalinus sp. TaxID=2047741 RepID=UPI00397AB670